jgi:hypothetical protein
VRWNLCVVLIFISFNARKREHFFMYVLAIWTSSFEKVQFSSVAHFLIGSLIWGSFVFWAPCIFWLSVQEDASYPLFATQFPKQVLQYAVTVLKRDVPRIKRYI